MAEEETAKPVADDNVVRQMLMARQPDYECYADSVFFGTSTYTIQMIFGVQDIGGTKPLALVRVSPEHAKVLAIMLKRTIKSWEENRKAQIIPPPEILAERNIDLASEW